MARWRRDRTGGTLTPDARSLKECRSGRHFQQDTDVERGMEVESTPSDHVYVVLGTLVVLAVCAVLIWGSGRAGQYIDEHFVRGPDARTVPASL